MLVTNPEIYKKVLLLDIGTNAETGQINWDMFFASKNAYKLLYTLQIIEAIMEDGEGEAAQSVSSLESPNSKKPDTAESEPTKSTVLNRKPSHILE